MRIRYPRRPLTSIRIERNIKNILKCVHDLLLVRPREVYLTDYLDGEYYNIWITYAEITSEGYYQREFKLHKILASTKALEDMYETLIAIVRNAPLITEAPMSLSSIF